MAVPIALLYEGTIGTAFLWGAQLSKRTFPVTGESASVATSLLPYQAAIIDSKHLPFHAVLMDSWYATKDLMLLIESLQKVYYCPLKANRQVDDSDR